MTQTVRMNTTNAVCPIGETTGKLIGLITLITAALVGYASYAAFMVFLYAGSLDWIRLDLSEVEKGMMFGLSPILKRSNAKPIHVNHLTIHGPYLGAPSSLPVHDHPVLVRPPPDNGPFVV
jgi:hypothetical protein